MTGGGGTAATRDGGEEVATVRWFRWGSSREEWPRSVNEVKGSSPRDCSGAGRARVSCPRRPVARRREGMWQNRLN
jgi:hypothetical protein